MSDEWGGRQVLIVGAARQGVALARYLAQKGADVTLNDQRSADTMQAAVESLEGVPVRWFFGGHPLDLLDGKDVVCVSGGVSLDQPLVAEAVRRGIRLSNDSQIFLDAAPCPVVGITGSAGKTTTTSLVGEIARESIRAASAPLMPDAPVRPDPSGRIWVGGNIGTPLIADVEEMIAGDLAIMELSSFQLEIMRTSPEVAVVLNLTPNHLDRHRTMEAYAAAKARILRFQGLSGAAILSRDDPGSAALAGEVRSRLITFGADEMPSGQEGVFLRDGIIFLGSDAGEARLLPATEIQLRGAHNLQNVLAACAIAAAAGLSKEGVVRGVRGFRGVPHRMEFVRTWGGADWINDSIATAPERAMAAVRSFGQPLVLIAGGRDKDLPWEEFGKLVAGRVDHLVLFGEAAGKIRRAVEPYIVGNSPTIHHYKGLAEAVRVAAELVEPGDVVLLSPGGTSYDEFRDFEERGLCFKQLVNKLS